MCQDTRAGLRLTKLCAQWLQYPRTRTKQGEKPFVRRYPGASLPMYMPALDPAAGSGRGRKDFAHRVVLAILQSRQKGAAIVAGRIK